MAPMFVTILRADAASTEIQVTPWQNVLQSVREGLGLKPGEWALREVGYPGGEAFRDDATWESEGESSAHEHAIPRLRLVSFSSCSSFFTFPTHMMCASHTTTVQALRTTPT